MWTSHEKNPINKWSHNWHVTLIWHIAWVERVLRFSLRMFFQMHLKAKKTVLTKRSLRLQRTSQYKILKKVLWVLFSLNFYNLEKQYILKNKNSIFTIYCFMYCIFTLNISWLSFNIKISMDHITFNVSVVFYYMAIYTFLNKSLCLGIWIVSSFSLL